MNLDTLKASLTLHEGSKARLYRDTEGKLTGGVGHNFDESLPQTLIDLILDFDIKTAIAELDRAFPSWRTHSSPRQNVLIEMMFNMGADRLSGFSRMWYALGQNDYTTAASEMLDSQWAKQVKGRATTLANQMRTGQ